MNLYNFILAYWDIILVVIAVIASLVYLAFKGEKGIVYKMLYALVTEAEKEFGGGTGTLKLATVIEKIYPQLPRLIKIFVTAQTIDKWVDEVLTEAKKTWEKNSKIAAYIDSETNKTAENTV